jgi:hypothetical protein
MSVRAMCKFRGDAVCKEYRQSGRFVSGGIARGQDGWGRITRINRDKITVPEAA